MTMRRVMFCSLLVVAYAGIPSVLAQNNARQKTQCLSIRVQLNGKPIDGPQLITLRTKGQESTASLEGGCFQVAPELTSQTIVDILFAVPGNRIYLPAISGSFLTVPWDVELEDKRFGRLKHLPAHARAREACSVVFHGGEPERGVIVTGCRKPAP